MRIFSDFIVAVSVSLLICNCASSPSKNRVNLTDKKFDFGKCRDARILMGVIANTFYQHGFEVLSSNHSLETDWCLQYPTEIESRTGVRQLRYKAVVSLTALRSLSKASLKLIYQAQDKNGGWRKNPARPETIDTIKTMQSEVIRELQRYTIQW
ncbi:MAG: hypothetical protein ACE5HS_07465 [bacterium]